MDNPRDDLSQYRHLVSWGIQARILTTEQAEQLLIAAAEHERDAAAVLERAKEVREVMFRIFAAIANEAVPSETDIAHLNEELARAMAHACLMQNEWHFAWDWCADTVMLDRVLWPIVRAAADLLVSGELRMVRLCAADDCAWLFLDTSKNQTRRWCNMKSCGNRAKARRFTARKRGQ
jgi:predicted RNA-binding Zn ribbon-like protein